MIKWKWRRKKWLSTRGYVFVYCPEHPKSNNLGFVQEHRLIIENHLKRKLNEKEQIHHINEKRDDNRLENLQLFSSGGKHTKLHLEKCLTEQKIIKIMKGK